MRVYTRIEAHRTSRKEGKSRTEVLYAHTGRELDDLLNGSGNAAITSISRSIFLSRRVSCSASERRKKTRVADDLVFVHGARKFRFRSALPLHPEIHRAFSAVVIGARTMRSPRFASDGAGYGVRLQRGPRSCLQCPSASLRAFSRVSAWVITSGRSRQLTMRPLIAVAGLTSD